MKTDKPVIFILTGPVHSGKSGALLQWVKGKPVAGFITPTINNKKVLVDIVTNTYYPYEVAGDVADTVQIGKYFLSLDAFKIADNIVESAIATPGDWFVFDEVGKLELGKNGHHKSLNLLFSNWTKNLLLVVREQLLDEVISSYKLSNYQVISKQQLENIGMAQ